MSGQLKEVRLRIKLDYVRKYCKVDLLRIIVAIVKVVIC